MYEIDAVRNKLFRKWSKYVLLPKTNNSVMDPDDVITFSDAARQIGCSRTTLYRAVEDGRLNDIEVGGRRMLFKDAAWESFEPKWKGGRVRKLQSNDNE